MDTLKQLHTSVAQSFEVSFDNAYRDLNAELARRDGWINKAEEAAKVANEAHGSAAARVQELEREVADLKDKSHPCVVDLKSKKFSTSMQETYGPEHVLFDDSGMDGFHPEVKAQIMDIGAKYWGLYKHFDELIGVCGTLRAKVDSHKRKLVQWQDRITREEFTIELSGTPVKFQRAHGVPTTRDQRLPPSRPRHSPLESSEPVNHTARTAEASTLDSNQPKPKSVEDPQEQAVQNEHGAGSIPRPSSTTELLDSASTNSEPPSASEETASNECISDTSTGTVTRELKRKRVPLSEADSSMNDDITDGKLQRPIVIKSESMSSSPLRNFSEYCVPMGTQDLDEIGSCVETPTKKNRHNPDSHSQGDLTGTNLSEGASDNFHCTESERRTPRRSGALRPIDGNSRAVSFVEQRSMKPKRNLEKRAKHAIPSIAEDGENYINIGMTKRIGNHTRVEQSLSNTNNAPAQHRQQRLQDLLEGPLPCKLPLNAQRSPGRPVNTIQSTRSLGDAVDQSSTSDRWSVSAASPRPLREAQETQEPRVQTSVAQTSESSLAGVHANPSEVRPGDRPYRDRPLEQLELSHFKINSDYNHGLAFAFDTVVRKKDERKCMAGCTRPGCCGEKFLSMIRIGGLPTNLEGFGPEAGEQKTLEEYLGEDKHLLNIMDPKERAGLLHEAQAKRLADTCGKHRHTHPRPSTPPGFWRTDMPDTQELEHDREESRKLEREKIHERYREASRPGGLWRFADE